MIPPCKQYLGFDDRKLMLLGIPVLSFIMPFMLNIYGNSWEGYLVHMVPESFFFVTGFWFFYRTMIIALRKRFPRFNQTKKRLIIEGLLLLISAPILKAVFGWIIYAILSLCNIVDHVMPGYVLTLFSIYLPSALIVTIYEARFFFTQYKEAVIAREKIKKEHIQTQLEHLRNQINPHFLFNSLNTLMNLIPVNPKEAQDFLAKLSRFYRFTVSQNDAKLIPLDREIECVKLYSDLLEERFKSGIRISYDLSGTSNHYILPMTLQLLIENAVKHNIVSVNQPLDISVYMQEAKKRICVRNNVQKKLQAVESTGMGLGNIKKRYSYFTDVAVLVSSSDKQFEVCLPLLDSL